MAHTIVLVHELECRTYCDYESVNEAMEGKRGVVSLCLTHLITSFRRYPYLRTAPQEDEPQHTVNHLWHLSAVRLYRPIDWFELFGVRQCSIVLFMFVLFNSYSFHYICIVISATQTHTRRTLRNGLKRRYTFFFDVRPTNEDNCTTTHFWW